MTFKGLVRGDMLVNPQSHIIKDVQKVNRWQKYLHIAKELRLNSIKFAEAICFNSLNILISFEILKGIYEKDKNKLVHSEMGLILLFIFKTVVKSLVDFIRWLCLIKKLVKAFKSFPNLCKI